LVKGISFGSTQTFIQDVQLDLETKTLTGLMDLSSLIPSMPSVAFTVTLAGPTITFTGGEQGFPVMSFATALERITGSKPGGSGFEQIIINALKLNELTFQLSSITISLNPLATSLVAKLNLWGLKLDLSVVAGRFGGSFALGFAVKLTGENIKEFSRKAFPAGLQSAISMFKIDFIEWAFATQAIDFGDSPLNIVSKGSQMYRGFMFSMSIGFDKQSPNKLGAFLGSVLTSQLVLQLIVATDMIQLKLILPDLQLGKPLLIKDNTLAVTLKFPADLMISVSTTVMMTLPSKEQLGFTATIGLVVTPTPGIYMSLVMVAPWKKAFGIEALTILQLGGSVTIVSTPPYLKAIELNAGMQLGPISIIGGVGIDLTNPKGIFFYAKVNGLTMGNIVKIFKPSLNLPPFLGDTGFQGEAAISFTVSPNGAVSLTNVEIPFGFRAKGLLNLFGYKAEVDINIGKTGFKIFAKLDPIYVGAGLIQLSKSKTDISNGPVFDVELMFNNIANAHIDIHAYVKFLLFSADVQISISAKAFSIDVTVPIGPCLCLEAKVYIRAALKQGEGKLGSGGIELKVNLSMQKFLDAVQSIFLNIQKMVNAVFDRANAKLERAKMALENAKCNINRDCGWCNIELSSLAELHLSRERLEYLSGGANGTVPTGPVAFLSVSEFQAIHDHVAHQSASLSLEDKEDLDLLPTEEEHWTPAKEAHFNAKIQSYARVHQVRGSRGGSAPTQCVCRRQQDVCGGRHQSLIDVSVGVGPATRCSGGSGGARAAS